MNVDALRIALSAILPTTVLIGANQLFLLRINRDRRIVSFELPLGLRVDVFKLRIPIGMQTQTPLGILGHMSARNSCIG